MKPEWRVAALALAWFAVGCQFLRSEVEPYTPRPDQTVWLDEPAVMALVSRFVYESRFESRRPLAERQYAALIRSCYTRVSVGGQDLDGGRRAVNFIHKIHRDAKGPRELWERVLESARQPPLGQDGVLIPSDVR